MVSATIAALQHTMLGKAGTGRLLTNVTHHVWLHLLVVSPELLICAHIAQCISAALVQRNILSNQLLNREALHTASVCSTHSSLGEVGFGFARCILL